MLTRGLEPKRLIGIGTALLFVLAACGDDGDDSASDDSGENTEDPEQTETDTAAPTLFGDSCTDDSSYVVQAKTTDLEQIEVFAEPDGEALHAFDATWSSAELDNPEDGTPLVFRLTDDADPASDWLHVDLPLPIPESDAADGYVKAADVTGFCHTWEITVDRAAHELTLTEGGEEKMTAPVGLGTDERATEPGEYYTTEVIDSTVDDYGDYAWAINGFSDDPEVIADFGDNPLGVAMVGIHGTNEPELIPGDVSNGCIRLKNEDISRFVDEFGLPYGVPVHVV